MSSLSIKRLGLAVLVVGLFAVPGLVQPLSREDVSAQINEALTPLPKLLNDDPSGALAQRHLIETRLPNSVILRYFYDVESPLHEPTPERRERVLAVEEMLAAHEPALIALLRGSASQAEVPDALHKVLNFVRPTAELKAALLDVTVMPTARSTAVHDAFNTIFKLKLDDEVLRQDVLTKIGYRDELHTRADLARDLLAMASAQWGMAELEPLFREFLSIPNVPENYPKRGGRVRLLTHYGFAATGLAAFGARAASFTDLLKARLAELDPATDRDLIKDFNQTIMIVEGKVNPKPVINFKGELLGISQVAWSEWKASQTPSDEKKEPNGATTSPGFTPRNNADPVTRRTNESIAATSGSNQWLVWVAVIVAALGLLWFALKKRK